MQAKATDEDRVIETDQSLIVINKTLENIHRTKEERLTERQVRINELLELSLENKNRILERRVLIDQELRGQKMKETLGILEKELQSKAALPEAQLRDTSYKLSRQHRDLNEAYEKLEETSKNVKKTENTPTAFEAELTVPHTTYPDYGVIPEVVVMSKSNKHSGAQKRKRKAKKKKEIAIQDDALLQFMKEKGSGDEIHENDGTTSQPIMQKSMSSVYNEAIANFLTNIHDGNWLNNSGDHADVEIKSETMLPPTETTLTAVSCFQSKAHIENIEKNRDTLLRCININVQVIACLRAAHVIDEAKESQLEAEKPNHDRVCLLIDWIKESPVAIYESFLNVMKENDQLHVVNLLTGDMENNHVPLSLYRHVRLVKIRPNLMRMIHNNANLIAALKSSNAISETDFDDLNANKGPNYRKNYHLINAIMRRSDYSFERLHEALINVHHQEAADYLKKGEVVAVHVNTTRPDLDEDISESINAALVNESMYETAVKEINIPHMNGLTIVGASPGHSVVILVYCKTTENMVTFTQLFNSGDLQLLIEDILNRHLTGIEPKSTERLKSRIRLNDEDVLAIEEITGIEDWMEEKCEKSKSVQSELLLSTHELSEVEEATTEGLSATSRKLYWKQEKRSLFLNFESLLAEEEEVLSYFLPETASSEQGKNWKQRRSNLSQGFETLLENQTEMLKCLIPNTILSEGDALTDELRHTVQDIETRLKEQQFWWTNLKAQVLAERRESIRSTFHKTSWTSDKIGFLLKEVRRLKCKLKETKYLSDKGDLFLALESLTMLRNLEQDKFVEHQIHQYESSKPKQLGSIGFIGTTTQEGSQAENFGTGSNFSELQSQGTTSTSFDDSFSSNEDVSPVDNVRKRRLKIPSASAAVRSCSDNDLPEASADNGNKATPASVRSRTSTMNKAQRIRQRYANSRATEDKLFNSWLESQIDTNAAKKLWLESDTTRNNAKVELTKLLRRKTLLEIQHLVGQVM